MGWIDGYIQGESVSLFSVELFEIT